MNAAFGKAVHCLAKIGEDLYLETSIDRVSMYRLCAIILCTIILCTIILC